MEPGGFEGARGDGCAYGTVPFAHVGAVAESAPFGQVNQVVERLGDATLSRPYADFAQTWRVDHQRAAGRGDQMACARGVLAASVGADFAGRLSTERG